MPFFAALAPALAGALGSAAAPAAAGFSPLLAGALGFGASQLLGGGGGQDPQVTPQSGLTPQQLQLLRELSLAARRGGIGQPGRVPPSGLGPVGPSALQEQAFGLAGQLPGQLAFDPAQITQQFQPTAEFARQGFQQETIPAIMAALGAQGAARSSGAADIVARQGRNLELGLASQLGQQQFGAQQAALGRQFQLPAQIANLGSLQRGIGGERQAFELQRFQAADPSRSPQVQLALQTAGLPAFQAENLIRPGTPGTLQQFLPFLGQVTGAAGQAGGFSNLFQGLF